MSKIINTISAEVIYSSLSQILNVHEAYIQHYIMKNMFKINKLNDIGEINVYDFFNAMSNITKIDYKNFENISFDTLTVAHLTTRLNPENIKQQPLFNLFEVLVQETDLSVYLKKKGFEFYKDHDGLQTKYMGKIVKWDKYFESNNSHSARMINRRFFGSKVVSTDKCVNGFLFNGNIQENRDVDHIYYSPEILQDICNVLNRVDIINYWEANASKYVVIFKADIKNTVFDKKPKLTLKQKTFRIYRYIIYYLTKSLLNNWSESYNPMIRLKDNLSVPVNDIFDVIKVS